MIPDVLKRLFPKKNTERRVLILGLDAAGKTTLLYRLHLGEILTTIPTIAFNVETVKAPTSGSRGPLNLECWDVGGCDRIRPLIRHYAPATEAVIWVLDSNDRERISEVREQMSTILNMVNEEGKPGGTGHVPCLILANKQELPGAMRIDEVHMKLGIITRPACAVFPTSLFSEDYMATLTPAMDWLYDTLSETHVDQSPSGGQNPQVPTDPLVGKLTSWIDRASEDTPPEEFLKAFGDVNLPSWDHYTHIRIAYTILKIYGRQKGKNMIFDGLEKYIKTSPQTTGRTFHVTMTYFWIQIVHFGMQSMPVEVSAKDEGNNDGFGRFLLLNPYVVDGNLWADYYTKGVIMTPEAKEQMVLPDKKPLPNLIARDSVRR